MNKPIVVGGRPLADQLAQHTHGITAATVETVRTRVAFYRSLPEEAVRGDVTAIIRRNLELFVASLRSLRPPSADELTEVRESARRRAEELVPLAEVLKAYHLGVEHWWTSIGDLARPEDTADVARAGTLLHAHLLAATTAVLAGYGSDRALPGEDDSARRALFLALTSGADPTAAAQRAGTDLPRLYWVVSIHVDPHPDERSADVDVVVAERRKVRRLQRELDNLGRDEALSVLSSSGGGVLIPILAAEPGPDDWQDNTQYAQLSRNLQDMERTIGAAVVAAVTVAAPVDVPQAYVHAQEILDVARRYGHSSGTVGLRDVALEYQLTRPTSASPVLAALLSPLDAHPGVLETLEAYLDAGCDRAAVADALHVHPNTVVYRLRKVAALTGLDVSSAPDVVRLVAALAARRSGFARGAR
ncbi:PucR family transcriptional regulator [Rhodococcus gannanensis]|uniref:PucR family transcriptional regulator n=1 Tax=Rhodococcus gannanensis TaxID=1960308 RepID=A0ABW4PBH9_9NOCA